ASFLAHAPRGVVASPAIEYRLGGYVHVDLRAFPGDGGDAYDDELLLRRLRPSLQGTVAGYHPFRILLDTAGGTLQVLDAYVEAAYLPEATLRIGKFKVPVGLERLQSATSLLFVERALPTLLAPNR